MKKAMISQPMASKTDEEISAVRERAVAVLRGMGYEVVDSLFEGDFYSDEQMKERGITQIPLYFLAKSLEGWKKKKPFTISKWRFTRKRIQGIRVPFLARKKHRKKSKSKLSFLFPMYTT